ncbi:MAG TPA: hypothetical protein VLE23_07955 [Geminicoccaceae bacterium]|nr:hypothetical protein [Geminicoccaceae bacterium]
MKVEVSGAMDLATLFGVGAGTAVVLMGGDFMSFVNVPNLLIVIGGAIAATVLASRSPTS